MLNLKHQAPGRRVGYALALLAGFVLLAGTQAQAASGVGFVTNGSEVAFELPTPSENRADMLTLTISAPKAGYVALTGSGYLILNASSADPIWVGAVIQIGPNSAGSDTADNENGTVVGNPAAKGTYSYPFSITTVIPVQKGVNNFYMVGSTYANAAYWAGVNLKLTAIFIDKLISP